MARSLAERLRAHKQQHKARLAGQESKLKLAERKARLISPLVHLVPQASR